MKNRKRNVRKRSMKMQTKQSQIDTGQTMRGLVGRPKPSVYSNRLSKHLQLQREPYKTKKMKKTSVIHLQSRSRDRKPARKRK
jgi:hypothetical protein